jgi:hypothetical protein
MYINLETFLLRTEKLGISIDIMYNFPWVYITRINGKLIHPDDYYQSRHGFTLGYQPIRIEEEIFKFSNITQIFKLIRKYAKNTNVH